MVLGLELIKKVFIGFFILSVLSIVIFLALISLRDIDTLSSSVPSLNSDTILADNGSAQTLSQLPVSNLNTIAHNTTWLIFDGTNDDIDFGNSSDWNRNNQNYTLSIWINTTQNATAQDIIMGVGTTSANYGLMIGSQGGGDQQGFCLRQRNGGQGTFNESCLNGFYNYGQWYHLVGVQNSTHLALFLDGVLNNTIGQSLSPNNVASDRLKIGEINSGGDLNGTIDEARLYNRSLSQDEISEIYNSGRTPNSSLTDSGLVFWSPLNENSGTDAHYFNVTGSVNFTDNIIGATWANDGIDTILTEDTDYTILTNQFKIINLDYGWSELNVSYDFSIITNEVTALVGNVTSGITNNFFNQTGTIFAILIVIVIILAIAIIIFVVTRFGGVNQIKNIGGFGSNTLSES